MAAWATIASKLRKRASGTRTPGFGEWVLHSFTGDEATERMTFAQLEGVCSRAASLLCGAVLAEPEWAWTLEEAGEAAEDAALIARRTADGFRAALADGTRVVLAWPWDHLGTRCAWLATRDGDPSVAATGERLLAASAAYARRHRDQLRAACTAWEEIAASVQGPGPRPSLTTMGRQALELWQREVDAG